MDPRIPDALAADARKKAQGILSLGFGSWLMAHGSWHNLLLWLRLQKRNQHTRAHEGFRVACGQVPQLASSLA